MTDAKYRDLDRVTDLYLNIIDTVAGVASTESVVSETQELLVTLLQYTDQQTRYTIAHKLEFCPVHLCDQQICADDNVTECQEARR